MGKDDWALIISFGSLAIAMAGFIWNVWSKFIYPKPKVRVSFWVAHIIKGKERGPQFLSLDIINHGPEYVIIHAAVAIKQSSNPFRRNRKTALINPIHDLRVPELGIGPFAGGLPKRVEVGETFSLYFPFEAGGWLAEPFTRIGVTDTFGRFHWAPRKYLERARKSHKEQFG